MFEIDKNLKNDCIFIKKLDKSQLLLMNNSNFKWLVLVPEITNAVELTDLEFSEQIDILNEINIVAKILQNRFNPTKINIATLGNIVKQLHIHIIARFENDIAFPKPVWGFESKKYQPTEAQYLIEEIKNDLKFK